MKILLLDIETSPNLVWTFQLKRAYIGPEAIVNPSHMLCFAAKWLGEDKTEFYSEWNHGTEGMVRHAHRLLEEADVVLHFNGERFDIPRLNNEFARFDLFPPAPFEHIDLCKAAFKAFDLPSHKLTYVLQHFDLPNKLSTGGIGLWIAVMNGETWAQQKMARYNQNDVTVLEALYAKMRPWIKGHPNRNLYDTVDACPLCGSQNIQKRGLARTRISVFQRYQCQDCGGWFREGKREFGSELRQVA